MKYTYLLLVLTPIFSFAEYQKVTDFDSKSLCIGKCFENKDPNALIRMIDIIGIPSPEYDVVMHITLDGADRNKTADILVEAFYQAGIEIHKVTKNKYNYGNRQYCYTRIKLKYILLNDVEKYKNVLDKIHEVEAISPEGMLEKIKSVVVKEANCRRGINGIPWLRLPFGHSLFQPQVHLPPHQVEFLQNQVFEQIRETLRNRYVSAGTHQRDDSKTLNPNHYTEVQSEEDLELECCVCAEKIHDVLATKSRKVVKLNCSKQGHTFCLDCIAESYKYQQICPVCRSKIVEKG